MSLRSFIAKKISYPLQDLVNGTSILRTTDALKESQHWHPGRQQSYQFEKFLRLLDHSTRHVPYYRELFKRHGLQLSDIKNPDDLHKIPVLTKETARVRNDALVAENVREMRVIRGVTGGTTGPPLKLLRDIPDRTFTWAAFFRWYGWMGFEYGDRMVQLWGTPTVLHESRIQRWRASVKDFYYNRHIINSFQLNERTIPGVLHRIESTRPVFIRGYLSALIQLAGYILDHGIRLSHIPMAVSSTTETLLPPFKELIEKAFRSTLFDQYGCGECNSIAFDAGDGNGLYIAVEHCLLEILDELGREAGDAPGRFIVTNLDNFAMPFIRYENGDSGRFSSHAESPEIRLPAIREVLGRTADTVILNDGSRVHGVFFTDILNELFAEHPASIHRFQAVQQKAGSIEFRIEKATPPDPAYLEAVEQALRRFFDEVRIVTMPLLPVDDSGKFRYIISPPRS
ncbi:MAG TPA: phenylacetate--CoA ligase family protein [Bacteroides sp.]|nr:phenylacetate--CoA ligase family protein [Bacteroides sp.]